MNVVQAFGAQPNSENAPSQDVLASLVKLHSPRSIWRTVCAHKAGFKAPFPDKKTWAERVDWVENHPEQFDKLLKSADEKFHAEGKTLVILFDALDRLAEDWPSIRPLAKGLLQVALDLRATKRIRFKVFVRPDILQDRAIISFPDVSKLLARKAALTWRRADLYALLFQCLGNSPKGGLTFRSICKSAAGVEWKQSTKMWLLPEPLRTDERLQEGVFVRLAGKAMGTGASSFKRGKPYSWLVNHLQDGLDQVSPRSFFAAVRQAADETAEGNTLALDYRAIQAGVQAASKIRVDEITGEDYPWVDFVMRPLRGRLTVPCSVGDVEAIWKKEQILKTLENDLRSVAGAKLPPQSLAEGPEGVLSDLQSLGLVKRIEDGRIQMPDVYRIAFGLGRRGGVKPLR
jgi:hypothetical protein